MKVFIIGIAGGTGLRLARLLTKRDDVVSGLYRRSEQLALLSAIGVEGTFGDVATITAEDLARAVTGVDAIIFAAGAGSKDGEFMVDAVDGEGVRKAADAARLAGVSRFILVSVFPEAWRERHMPKEFEHYMTAKKRADVSLAHSELDWVILRPSALTDEAGTGKVSLGLAEIHDEISREDVAATIAILLQEPRISRKILEVTAGNTPIADAVTSLADLSD